MKPSDANRGWRIAIASSLIAAVVFVGGRLVLGSTRATPARLAGVGGAPSLPVESDLFPLAVHTLQYAQAETERVTPPGGRTLSTFYQRRAYPGAPPVIPHHLLNAKTWGDADCLSCHRDGGYSPGFGAMTPVTPHPNLQACVQCHVPQQEAAGLFQTTTFAPVPAPEIDGSALPGSPPPIPHDLQMRTNCVACHAGPAAVREVRTDHPGRVNCLQCHAWSADPGAVFRRVGQ